MTCSKRCVGVVLAATMMVAAFGRVATAERFTLVSAQVVTSTDRPSTLRILANGPIAFAEVPESRWVYTDGGRLVLELFGVDAGALTGTQWLGDYVLTVQPGPGEATRLTVGGGQHEPGALVARLGAASHVLEICACGQ